MKRNRRQLLIAVLIIFILTALPIAFKLSTTYIPELLEGNPSIDFCSKECGANEYIFSNNNTEFNFIHCECLIQSKINRINTKLDTKHIYFNAGSQKEINKTEVVNRVL